MIIAFRNYGVLTVLEIATAFDFHISAPETPQKGFVGQELHSLIEPITVIVAVIFLNCCPDCCPDCYLHFSMYHYPQTMGFVGHQVKGATTVNCSFLPMHLTFPFTSVCKLNRIINPVLTISTTIYTHGQENHVTHKLLTPCPPCPCPELNARNPMNSILRFQRL